LIFGLGQQTIMVQISELFDALYPDRAPNDCPAANACIIITPFHMCGPLQQCNLYHHAPNSLKCTNDRQRLVARLARDEEPSADLLLLPKTVGLVADTKSESDTPRRSVVSLSSSHHYEEHSNSAAIKHKRWLGLVKVCPP
jgi:hypothetical protein